MKRRPAGPGPGQPLPEPVARIVAAHQRGGVGPEVCAACPSFCCSQGGFAIFENLGPIHDLYRSGRLRRAGFRLPAGLSLAEFVETCFDVWERQTDSGPLACFHLKSVGPAGELISIPDVADYWQTREALFELNPWLNRGCLFLSAPIETDADPDGPPRRCLLHAPDSGLTLTAKPIDCVLHTCTARLRLKPTGPALMRRWFAALAAAWPAGGRRYRRLIDPAVTPD